MYYVIFKLEVLNSEQSDPKANVSYCHHFAPVVRPSTITKKISSESTLPIKTKFWWNGPWVIPFQIFSGSPELQPTWPLLLNIKKGG
jgi:hypothetical protein